MTSRCSKTPPAPHSSRGRRQLLSVLVIYSPPSFCPSDPTVHSSLLCLNPILVWGLIQWLQTSIEILLPSSMPNLHSHQLTHFPPPPQFFFFIFFLPCVTNFTHFLSLSRIVKDLIRAFPVLIVIRTVIVRAIKGNWATAEWKSP